MESNRCYGVILTGASCTGKSFLIEHVEPDYPHLNVYDMDLELYARPHEVRARLPEYTSWLTETIDSVELRDDVRASEALVQVPKIALLKLIARKRPFLTTCGGLPPPDDAFYTRTRQATRFRLYHVLLDPSRLTHYVRILKRLRVFRALELRRKQRDKMQHDWDATVRTINDLKRFLDDVTT